MNKLTRIISAMLLAITVLAAQAQTAVAEPEDFMHSNGKMYVVVAILLGLFFYVYSLDRKISKMEK